MTKNSTLVTRVNGTLSDRANQALKGEDWKAFNECVKEGYDFKTALAESIKTNDADKTLAIVRSGVDTNFAYENGDTPLTLMIKKGNNRNADKMSIEERKSLQSSNLIAADIMIEKLPESNFLEGLRPDNKNNILLLAINHRRTNLVKNIIAEASKNPKLKEWLDESSRLAFEHASKDGDVHVMKILSAHGAKAVDKDGNSLLDNAIEKENISLVEKKLLAGIRPSSNSLKKAVTAKNPKLLPMVFEKMILGNDTNIVVTSWLKEAIEENEKNLDTEFYSERRDTLSKWMGHFNKPLTEEESRSRKIELTQKEESDLNKILCLSDISEESPVMLAVKRGWSKHLRVMLEVGYEKYIDEPSKKDGNRPIQEALLKGRAKCVSILVKKGADLFVKNKDGKSAADIAGEDANHYAYIYPERALVREMACSKDNESCDQKDKEDRTIKTLEYKPQIELKLKNATAVEDEAGLKTVFSDLVRGDLATKSSLEYFSKELKGIYLNHDSLIAFIEYAKKENEAAKGSMHSSSSDGHDKRAKFLNDTLEHFKKPLTEEEIKLRAKLTEEEIFTLRKMSFISEPHQNPIISAVTESANGALKILIKTNPELINNPGGEKGVTALFYAESTPYYNPEATLMLLKAGAEHEQHVKKYIFPQIFPEDVQSSRGYGMCLAYVVSEDAATDTMKKREYDYAVKQEAIRISGISADEIPLYEIPNSTKATTHQVALNTTNTSALSSNFLRGQDSTNERPSEVVNFRQEGSSVTNLANGVALLVVAKAIHSGFKWVQKCLREIGQDDESRKR